jgi:hypothetical protein
MRMVSATRPDVTVALSALLSCVDGCRSHAGPGRLDAMARSPTYGSHGRDGGASAVTHRAAHRACCLVLGPQLAPDEIDTGTLAPEGSYVCLDRSFPTTFRGARRFGVSTDAGPTIAYVRLRNLPADCPDAFRLACRNSECIARCSRPFVAPYRRCMSDCMQYDNAGSCIGQCAGDYRSCLSQHCDMGPTDDWSIDEGAIDTRDE